MRKYFTEATLLQESISYIWFTQFHTIKSILSDPISSNRIDTNRFSESLSRGTRDLSICQLSDEQPAPAERESIICARESTCPQAHKSNLTRCMEKLYYTSYDQFQCVCTFVVKTSLWNRFLAKLKEKKQYYEWINLKVTGPIWKIFNDIDYDMLKKYGFRKNINICSKLIKLVLKPDRQLIFFRISKISTGKAGAGS